MTVILIPVGCTNFRGGKKKEEKLKLPDTSSLYSL